MSVIQSQLLFPVKKKRNIIRSKTNIELKKCVPIEIVDADNFKVPVISEINLSPRKNRRNLCVNATNNNITPPKQRRLSKHGSQDNRENETNSSPKTPSSLLSKLDLNAICNEITDSEKHSRKKLFDDGNEKYNNARRALHSTVPTHMPARNVELEKLHNFIGDHLENNTSGTMYISGPPGTGKTAALTKILSELEV